MNAIACCLLTFLAGVAYTVSGTASDRGSERPEQVAQRQLEAARTILMYGGDVTFQNGSHCTVLAKLSEHRANSVMAVAISEEELMIGAPNALSIKGCMAQLESLPMLQSLSLTNPDFDDGMLKHLETLNHLRDLVIVNENVTDVGLAHLTKLSNLHTLYLRATKTTDEGIKKLQGVLPKCKITVEK